VSTPEVRSQAMSEEAPPLGDEIHLPGPSLVPLVNAFGVALALIGLALTLTLTYIGLAIFLVSTVRWVRTTRRDIDALPRDR
jgi:hypothetical protein